MSPLDAATYARPICEDHGKYLDPSGTDHLCRDLTDEELAVIDAAGEGTE